MKSFAALPTLLLLTVTSSNASKYWRTDRVVGQDFYNFFDFEAIPDPTHGRVTYVDKETAIAQNLTYACGDSFVLRTDHTTVLTPEGPGRNSVRLQSRKTYTTHVAIFDVRHAPQGCGTWPAIWETKGSNWPYGGEIDIYEGVNDQPANAATLHTATGCTMPAERDHLGTSKQDDCDWLVNGNAGCGVSMNTPVSYGPWLNPNGGGWFALERNDEAIKVWFWSRNARIVPNDVREGAANVNTARWGTPQAHFPNTQCDFRKFFQENNIIINLTLCGDWAGSPDAYAQAGCPSTCVDHVNNNPDAFREAYFDFASISIYAPSW